MFVSYMHDEQAPASAGATGSGTTPLPVVSVCLLVGSPPGRNHAVLHATGVYIAACILFGSRVFIDARDRRVNRARVHAER